MKLMGIKLPQKTSNLNGQSSVDCGNLWQQFEKEKVFDRIPGKQNDAVYAVYYDYEGDHTAPFSYFIGCWVDEKSVLPEGLESLELPEQNCTHFLAKGKMPDCIAEAWRNIWESDTRRSYGFDFEVYDERAYDWNNAEVDVFVSSD